MVIVVMGVSGCGKSAVGAGVAQRLGLPFYDADDFHPEANRDKMSRGEALTDGDRTPWLGLLAERIAEWNQTGGAVLACSALKRGYRDVLRRPGGVAFVFLDGGFETIQQRIRERSGHFMPASLLESQFATLERPGQDADDACVTVPIDLPLDAVIDGAVARLRSAGFSA